MITLDLHIHSKASEYKEAKGLVEDSTIENVDVLLNKLDENNVSLFSITDHNRFNVELYKVLDEKIQERYEKGEKGLLAGVEFDVKLDDEMDTCHIITIFDAKNDHKNYKKISDAIQKRLLKAPKEFYSRKNFEDLLKDIGLSVILIACQRNSMTNTNAKSNSLSSSTSDPFELISTGYINALEFQSPKVEGILLDNLKELPTYVGLITGSDCHQWVAYPNHDLGSTKSPCALSKARILPTFKGLLMAVTSPETRINCQSNTQSTVIEEFEVNGEYIPLPKGITAIIGENGSGKSTLLSLLSGEKKFKNYQETIIKNNNMSCNSNAKEIEFIKQGEIVNNYYEDKLFSNDLYMKVDNSRFEACYDDYNDKVHQYIKHRIKEKESLDKLKQKKLEYNKIEEGVTYYVTPVYSSEFSEVINEYSEPNNNLKNLILESKEYSRSIEVYPKLEEANKLIKEAIEKLEEAGKIVNDVNENVEADIRVRGIIINSFKNYQSKIISKSTSSDRDLNEYKKRKQSFIDCIVETIKVTSEENKFPEAPKPMDGFSSMERNGFRFVTKTEYDSVDAQKQYFDVMFTKRFREEAQLKEINTNDVYVEAIMSCSDKKKLEEQIKTNLDKFKNRMENSTTTIIDMDENMNEVGNTLGELSLAYYKYITDENDNQNILLIDQPEDHISNKNVSEKLKEYFNSIRYNKQLIIVTHNPLLVVNLDVDNVIFVEKKNDKLLLKHGCLEYEDEQCNILKLIADNMDGGIDEIRKRVKVYGEEN